MGKQREQPLIEAVKNSLAPVPVMAYFNVDAETRITTDAASAGLGARGAGIIWVVL